MSANAGLPRTGGLSWLPRLEDDYSNLLAALNWALVRRQAELLLRLASSLALFWEMRGRFGDGVVWLDRTLEMSEDTDLHALPVRARPRGQDR